MSSGHFQDMEVANGVLSTSGLDLGMERVIAALLGNTVDATAERHRRRVFASWRILVACGHLKKWGCDCSAIDLWIGIRHGSKSGGRNCGCHSWKAFLAFCCPLVEYSIVGHRFFRWAKDWHSA